MPVVTRVRIGGSWTPQLDFLTHQHLMQLRMFAKTCADCVVGQKWLYQSIQWPRFLNDHEIGVAILIFHFCVYGKKSVRGRHRPEITSPVKSATSVSYLKWNSASKSKSFAVFTVNLQKRPRWASETGSDVINRFSDPDFLPTANSASKSQYFIFFLYTYEERPIGGVVDRNEVTNRFSDPISCWLSTDTLFSQQEPF